MLRMNRISWKHLSNETKLPMICGDNTKKFYTNKVKMAWTLRKAIRIVMKEITAVMMIFMFNNKQGYMYIQKKRKIQVTVINIVPTLSGSTYCKLLQE